MDDEVFGSLITRLTSACMFDARMLMLIDANFNECIDICKGKVVITAGTEQQNVDKVAVEAITEWFNTKASAAFGAAYSDYYSNPSVSRVEFYLNNWNENLKVYDEDITRKALYQLCLSDSFVTLAGKEVQPQDLIANSASEAEVQAFKEMLASSNQSVSSLFDKIPNAEELSESVYAEQIAKIFAKITEGMIQRCLIGSSFLEIDCTEISDDVLYRLRGSLKQHHFVLKGNVVLSMKGDSVRKFEKEEDILKLKSNDGFDYWTAADRCRNKIIPDFLDKEIAVLVEALENVRVKDDSVTLKKTETKTNSYELLFDQLRDKSFNVTDNGDTYSLTWR